MQKLAYIYRQPESMGKKRSEKDPELQTWDLSSRLRLFERNWQLILLRGQLDSRTSKRAFGPALPFPAWLGEAQLFAPELRLATRLLVGHQDPVRIRISSAPFRLNLSPNNSALICEILWPERAADQKTHAGLSLASLCLPYD